jgi:hypothetical protein
MLYFIFSIPNQKYLIPTNLSAFFWRKVENIIRQKKKGVLSKFLFGSELNHLIHVLRFQNKIEKTIEKIENQLNYLQEKIIHFERKIQNPKYGARGENKASKSIKRILQKDSLNPNHS